MGPQNRLCFCKFCGPLGPPPEGRIFPHACQPMPIPGICPSQCIPIELDQTAPPDHEVQSTVQPDGIALIYWSIYGSPMAYNQPHKIQNRLTNPGLIGMPWLSNNSLESCTKDNNSHQKVTPQSVSHFNLLGLAGVYGRLTLDLYYPTKIRKCCFLYFGAVSLTEMNLSKLRKAHCSTPLVSV